MHRTGCPPRLARRPPELFNLGRQVARGDSRRGLDVYGSYSCPLLGGGSGSIAASLVVSVEVQILRKNPVTARGLPARWPRTLRDDCAWWSRPPRPNAPRRHRRAPPDVSHLGDYRWSWQREWRYRPGRSLPRQAARGSGPSPVATRTTSPVPRATALVFGTIRGCSTGRLRYERSANRSRSAIGPGRRCRGCLPGSTPGAVRRDPMRGRSHRWRARRTLDPRPRGRRCGQ